MKDFHQWLAEKGIELNEKGKRTALSANYPSLYHSIRQQPRQTWTPISATALLADKQIGPDEKVTDGGPNVTEKKDNPYKSFYSTEWNKFLDKKMDEIASAVGRAALPHIAKAAVNKMIDPKDKDKDKDKDKKMCGSCKNEGPVLAAIGSGAKKLATTALDKMTQEPAKMPPPQSQQMMKKKCKKMDEIAPVIAAAGRAILPHAAKAAGTALGTAAVNKVMPQQQQMKKHHKYMHQGDKPWMKTKGHPGKHKV